MLVAEFSNGAGRIPKQKSFSSAKVRRISSSQKSQTLSALLDPSMIFVSISLRKLQHFPRVTFADSIYSVINNNFNTHFDFQNSPSVSKMPL